MVRRPKFQAEALSERVIILVSPRMKKELETQAVQNGTSVAAIIRAALDGRKKKD